MEYIDTLHKLAKCFEQFAQNCDEVRGFYMCGSYAKGFLHENSDLDPVFIVRDGCKEAVLKDVQELTIATNIGCDLCIYELSEFEGLSCNVTSDMGSNRYDYAHTTLAVDKSGGKIQEIVKARGRLSDAESQHFGTGYLDGYINCFYRSLKAARQGWSISQKIEAAQSIEHALQFIFAADKRVCPYSKYLEWELRNHPLPIDIKMDRLIDKIMNVLKEASPHSQIDLFEIMTAYAHQQGFGRIVDWWDGKPEDLVKIFKQG